MSATESFPRRQARTRRFSLGEPRSARVSDDGARVAFLRSSGPVDPVNSLWVLDVSTGVEHLIADPRRLAARRAQRESGVEADPARPEDELPSAEKARRERVRETGSGIVSYHADAALTTAVFALGGILWRADLVGGTAPEMLPARPAAFDPRLSPDGRSVAYVAGPALCLVDGNGDRTVAEEPGDTVSWGVAEFVAAEEMGRLRGHWWSPDARLLLAARVDTARVPRWWISEPASPDADPTEIRYPVAGAPNADVRLAVFSVADCHETPAAGAASSQRPERVDVAWDEDGWEYLAAVRWNASGLMLAVQTRDQRTLAVLRADPDSGECEELRRVRDSAWTELAPGAPRLCEDRLITVEDGDAARRLCVDGIPMTSEDVQVRAVHHVDETGIVISACTDPSEVHVARVGWDADIRWLTGDPGVHSVAAGGDTLVIARRSLVHPGRVLTVHSPRLGSSPRRAGGRCDEHSAEAALEADVSERASPPGASVARDGGLEIASNAESAQISLNVEIVRLGPRRLVSALVLPSQDRGDQSLPVLLDPYGGPHAQRVQRAEALFHTSQWFADQGFAVLVIDGRGTPGRGPAFERAVRGDLAGPVLEDQVSGLQAAAERWPRLDLSRVAIRGWSFGGYLAALAVLVRPDLFAAAIAGAPVTDWRLYDTHYTERYLGLVDVEPENYERCDLTRLAGGLKRPLLLIHGLADDNVVAAHTLRLSRALLESARPHRVLPLSGVTHMASQEEVAESLLLLQLRFLQDALAMTSAK